MNKPITNDLIELKKLLSGNFGCGWMVDDVAMFIYSLVKFTKPTLVIQTGHLWGKSARFILEALEENTSPLSIETGILSGDEKFFSFTKSNSPQPKKGRLVSIDPNIFNLNEDVFKFLENKFDNFKFYKMTSKEFFSRCHTTYVDEIIFGIVDGDHTYNGCLDDLISLSDLLAKYIVVDDTLWIPELNSCCLNFSKEYNYSYINFPVYNGIGLLIKNE